MTSTTVTRKAITTQLREHCDANGMSYEPRTVNGALVIVIDGETYTPGQAADRFLATRATQ